jgi:hypothetical protein
MSGNLKLTSVLLALTLPVAACHTGPVVTAFDGFYTGEAANAASGVGNCISTRTVQPLTVSGGKATLGPYGGWVDPDGSLQMSAWQDGLTRSYKSTIIGRFNGLQFAGELKVVQAGAGESLCTYHLALNRE